MSQLPTWDQLRTAINTLTEQGGEWAGSPMPVYDIPLIIEKRYPHAGLNGFCFDGATGGRRMPPKDPDAIPPRVVNSWYSVANSATVYVCDDGPGTRRWHCMLPEWGGKRLGFAE